MTAHDFFQGIDFSGLTKKENEELKKTCLSLLFKNCITWNGKLYCNFYNKNSAITDKQLIIFLGYLLQECSEEYLSYSKIYNGKRNRNKLDLIGMIIAGKINEMVVDLGGNLTFQEANKILKGMNKLHVAAKFIN